MNNDELFRKCLKAAALLVAREKEKWPGCENAVAIDFGGGSSQQDTTFARKGTSGNTIQYGLPAFLSDLIAGNASSMPSDPSLAAKQTALFSSLLMKAPDAMQGARMLTNNMDIAPTSFTGASSLEKIAARDPYSTQFENDTQAAYEQRGKDAMAQAATGPDAVRGGNARTGIAQGVMGERLAQGRGQEVRAAQTQDAGIVQGADQLFNAIETARRGVAMGAQGQKAGQVLQQDQNALGAAKALDSRKVSNLAALQMASDLLGTKKGLTTDDLSGSGSQTNESQNWGVNILGGCCFIMLEALNGKLPWYIESARHDYYTRTRRHGYKWLANLLVPRMRRSIPWRSFVNAVLVKPFLRGGAWTYRDASSRWWYTLWCPVCELWLVVFSVLGTLLREKEVD